MTARQWIKAVLKAAWWSALVYIVLLGAGKAFERATSKPHSCTAPCTVSFPSGTEEDEFAVDWKSSSLRVWSR